MVILAVLVTFHKKKNQVSYHVRVVSNTSKIAFKPISKLRLLWLLVFLLDVI